MTDMSVAGRARHHTGSGPDHGQDVAAQAAAGGGVAGRGGSVAPGRAVPCPVAAAR
ncbi:hypothetical protein [Phytohabitans houttuyneae]|uniref:hypothetical protein n=1 Tax=Phytohabitans houttuyneae TaxID=1076126 RepID=UPI0015643DBE|nr:hypothetical protein [Phytohabitans houttuyneae]